MKGNKGKLNQCKVARNVRAPNRIKLIELLGFWCSYSGLVAKGGRGEEELFVLPGCLVVSCLALLCGQRNDVRVCVSGSGVGSGVGSGAGSPPFCCIRKRGGRICLMRVVDKGLPWGREGSYCSRWIREVDEIQNPSISSRFRRWK